MERERGKEFLPRRTKSSLGVRMEERPGTSKVLGVLWDVADDKFRLDI